jgi:DNA-directed RNA polymerase specialized sigma24 family protein
MHELHKGALEDLVQGIYDQYQGRNQTLGREENGRVVEEPDVGGGGGFSHSKMDTAIVKLTGMEVTELERDINRIEDVYKNLTPRQQQFFDLHYKQHLNIVDTAMHMNYCRKQAHTIKHEVIEKTAVRLGYIR